MQEDKNHKHICIYQHCLKFYRLLIGLCIHDKIIRKIQYDFVLIHSSLTKGMEGGRERDYKLQSRKRWVLGDHRYRSNIKWEKNLVGSSRQQRAMETKVDNIYLARSWCLTDFMKKRLVLRYPGSSGFEDWEEAVTVKQKFFKHPKRQMA